MSEINLIGVKKGNGIIGLMFRKKINQLYSFHLGSIDKSVHTMFCFCSMDALCLDDYGFVVKKIHMPPWKIFYCGNTAVAVIEGPVGAFRTIKLGDIIVF